MGAAVDFGRAKLSSAARTACDWSAFGEGIIGIVSLCRDFFLLHVTYEHWVQLRAIGTPGFSVSINNCRMSTWVHISQSRARPTEDDSIVAVSQWVYCCHQRKHDNCRDARLTSTIKVLYLAYYDHHSVHLTALYSCTLVHVHQGTCHRVRDYAGPSPDHGHAYLRAAHSVSHLLATKYCDSGPLLTHGHPFLITGSLSVYLTCYSSFPPLIPLHPARGQSNRQQCSPHILRASSTFAHKKSLNHHPTCFP